MSSLHELRARYREASSSDLLALAEPSRRRLAPLSPEAWLALSEEMERRGIAMPDDTLADLELDLAAGAPPAPPPWDAIRRVVRYPKAPLVGRFVAMLIDGVVGVAPGIAAAVALFTSATWPARPDGEFNFGPLGGVFGLALVAAIGWWIYYSFTKDGRRGGQSIGKGAMGLMVVDVNTNQPCTRGASAIRALVMAAVGMFPLIGGLIEPIVVLAAEDGRRLGDRAANTQVISEADYRPGTPVRRI